MGAYEAFLAIALVASLLIARSGAARVGERIGWLAPVAAVTTPLGLVAAKAAAVVYRGEAPSWEELLSRGEAGGAVLHAGVLTALLGGAALLRLWAPDPRSALDILTPAVLGGMAFLRVGCFLEGCCYGRPIGQSLAIHPTQLYSVVANLAIAVLLFLLLSRRSFHGQVLAAGMVAHSLSYFSISFLRADAAKAPMVGPLGFSQVATLPVLAVGMFLLWKWSGGLERARFSFAVAAKSPPRARP